jgi:hypothetical protein
MRRRGENKSRPFLSNNKALSSSSSHARTSRVLVLIDKRPGVTALNYNFNFI